MSCISSNFSSFFLNSLNDPSEFSKYLSNGELRFSSSFEDFQVYGQAQQQQQQQQQYQQHHINNGELINGNGDESNSNLENTQPIVTSVQNFGNYQPSPQHQMHPNQISQLQQQQTRWALPQHQHQPNSMTPSTSSSSSSQVVSASGAQHFDGSFEFMKYLRHSNDYNDTHSQEGSQNQTQSSHTTIAVGTKPEATLNNSFMDLDNAHKRAAARKTPVLSSVNGNNNANNCTSHHPTPMAIDIYDHDSKHNIYDLHHMNSVHSSNSNESSMELSSMTYPNSHLNASNSNTSSEGGSNNPNHSDFSMLSGVASSQNSTSSNAAAAASASPAAPKPLASFTIMENFEAHPSHKVEEGIFQHMNKLPSKKKENLKQLGVRFTGQMTLNDKSIIVENFIKFCQEYDIKDHRPFLTLNQSGLNKPDQIKFARYLGQGLPTFTLFCIYSNFKNLFCTKRTEIYTKDGYNLPYILDKVKRFLANTTAGNNNNNASNSSSTSITTTTSTTIAASSSNTNSTNSDITPNNTTNITSTTTTSTTTTTTTIMNTNNSHNNNAINVPVSMQNGNSVDNGDDVKVNGSNSSSSSNSMNTGNDNDKGIGNSSSSINNNNNDIINTPTKQIYNVPSPVTPRTSQIQQQQPHQPMQIQQTPTQNTPLPAHPPPTTHTIIATHHATTPQNHLQLQHNNHQQQQQQQIHHHHLPHMQIPMSSMVIVSTAAPSAIMVSPMVPTTVATVTQATANHNQLQLQHPHHMQPNNHHLPIQLHPQPHPHPLHVHPLNQPSMQQHTHHTSAANNTSVAVTTAPNTTFAYQQQHHHQLQLQHHPLHNLAAQNPPL